MEVDTTTPASPEATRPLSPCEEAYKRYRASPSFLLDQPSLFEAGWNASQEYFYQELHEMITDADWRSQTGHIPAVTPQDRLAHLVTGWIYRTRGMMDQIRELNDRLSVNAAPSPNP